MSHATWNQVSARRKEQNLATVPWKQGTLSRQWCDIYAADHARWLARQLSRKRITVSEQSLYLAWNFGLSVAIKVRGELSAIHPIYRDRFLRFSNTPIPVL